MFFTCMAEVYSVTDFQMILRGNKLLSCSPCSHTRSLMLDFIAAAQSQSNQCCVAELSDEGVFIRAVN